MMCSPSEAGSNFKTNAAPPKDCVANPTGLNRPTPMGRVRGISTTFMAAIQDARMSCVYDCIGGPPRGIRFRTKTGLV